MLLLVLAVGRSIAQQPKFFPLQPHKVQWANAVIKNALKTKDTIQLAEGYYLYGKIYEASGDWLTAKRYFMRSLRIQEKKGDSFELSRLYLRLAGIEGSQMRYTETLHYARLALSVAKRIQSDQALMRAYSQLSAIHWNDWTADITNANAPKSNYDSAFYYLKKAEPIARRMKDPMAVRDITKNLGHEMLRRKNPKSIAYLEEALAICIQQKEIYEQVIGLLSLSEAYIAFGKTQKAYELLTQAKTIQDTLPSNPSNDYRASMRFEGHFVHYYQVIGDWERAYKHLSKLFELERNRFLADREGAMSRLSVEYETEKKEAQLKSQQKELVLSNENQTIQRRFLMALSFILVGATVAIVVVYRLYLKNQQISRQNTILVREQNHRVKNNLQIVSSLLTLQSNRFTDEIAKSAVEDTQLRIEVMTILQRKLYDGDQLASVNLLEFISELLEIVLQTFGQEHVEITYDIFHTLEVSVDHALRIGLIVNELATNACKYAFADHPHPTFSIACSVQKGIFEMKVADNGKGFKPPNPSKSTKKTSFGMRLIQLQVEQLYGTYQFYTRNGATFEMQFKV